MTGRRVWKGLRDGKSLEQIGEEISAETKATSIARGSHLTRDEWLDMGREAINRAAAGGKSPEVAAGIVMGLNDSLAACGFAPTTVQELYPDAAGEA